MRGRWAAALAVAIASATLAACGSSGGDGGTTARDGEDLIVAAASSLTTAFTRYGEEVVNPQAVRFSFAGSDQLAAQIRQGAKPDVFAAANTSLPEALHREGLVARPVVFAGNELVLAVPAQGGAVHSLADLATPGITLAIGAESVPIGAYTRAVLGRLGRTQEQAILANVRSQEPDVSGIVGKLQQGAVDAGFVYLTDVLASRKRLGAIPLPTRLAPRVGYAIAVVRGAPHRAQARRFVAGLLRGQGLRILRSTGFAPPGR